MTDPNYKQSLIDFFKSRGFKYKDIDSWMERNKIDEKILEAKTNAYAKQYQDSIGKDNYLDAGFALSNLASIDPKKASALMAMFPNAKDIYHTNVNRENALLANQMRNEAATKQFQRQVAMSDRNFEHQLALAAAREQMNVDAYRNKLRIEAAQIAKVYGEDAAEVFIANKLAGINRGGRSSGNTGGNGKAGSTGGEVKNADISQLASLLKQRGEWTAQNPNVPFPLEQQFKELYEKVNGIGQYDPNDYNSVVSQATKILEMNNDFNYDTPENRQTADELKQAISALGPYGEQYAEQLARNGLLANYSRNNAKGHISPTDADSAYKVVNDALDELKGKWTKEQLKAYLRQSFGYNMYVDDIIRQYDEDGTLDEYARK